MVLLLGLLCCAPRVRAQYTLDELSVNAGGGLALFHTAADAGPLLGPGVHASFVYGHYVCGKAYGFHLEGGFASFMPTDSDASNLFQNLPQSRIAVATVNASLGAYAKIRPRDYHRPREVALLVGPKVLLPFLSNYNVSDSELNGPLRDIASVSAVQVGGHLAVQIRRPAPEKKSWFIEPGLDYYFTPAFDATPAANVRNFYAYLSFGFAFWDKRG
ncbi:MAG: hypothetical protein AAGN35_24175 [Bacteroidota bacterium]